MTADLEQSIDFYTTVLELSVSERGKNSVAFATGDTTLKVERDHDEATLESFGLEPPGPNRGQGVVIVLEVEDVDAVYERANQYGACEVLSPPRSTDWGNYLSLIQDPDGYVIEVTKAG